MEGKRFCSKKGLIVILSFHNWLELTHARIILGNLFNTLELNVKQVFLQAHFDLVFSFSFQATRKKTQEASFLSVGSVDWDDKTLVSYKVTAKSDMRYSLEFNTMWFLRISQNCWAKTFDSFGGQGVIGLTSGLYESFRLGVKKEGRAKMIIFPIFNC